jgi:uncharacterized protein (DUF58 family)
VTRRGTARVEGYAVLAAVSLLAALALRRPELAIAAAPFALVLAVGTRLTREPRIEAALRPAATRTLEKDDVEAVLELESPSAVGRLEVLLDLPDGVDVVDGDRAFALRLDAGEERAVPVTLSCSRWGVFDVGNLDLRATDLLRFVTWERRLSEPRALKAYPRLEPVRRVISALETQVYTGNEVARHQGDGIEYADLRDFVPGDRVRSINWRASARRQGLVVNERHPERNTDVVILVDSFLDLGAGDRSTLDDTVRAAATLAARYLERRDRVGLVGYGGILRWLRPGMGVGQRFRLIETLLETGVEPTFTWRDVNLIPARILAPKALVVALTPLVDARFVAMLEDLRARRVDLVVVEVDPSAVVEPASGRVAELAHRLWLLERDVLRMRLERAGVAVGRWGDEVSLEGALEGVRTFRRYARRARV